MVGRWIEEDREWRLREAYYGRGRGREGAPAYDEDSYRDDDYRGRDPGLRSFSPATGGYEPSPARRRAPSGPVFGEYESGAGYSRDDSRQRAERRGPQAAYGEPWTGAPRGERAYRDAYGYGPRDDLSRQAWEGHGPRREARDHPHDHHRDYGRNFLDRTAERLSSWFAGEDDGRRGRADRRGEGPHRGRGPAAYKRADERISDEVHDRLTEDAWVDASNISVSVSAGEVTLSGTVPEREAKHRAERLIEDLSGVVHVQNNLRVARGNFLTTPAPGFGDSVQAAQMAEGDDAARPPGRRADS